MKFTARLILTFVAFPLMFGMMTLPAEAHRPLIQTQIKCVNKSCTIIKTRECYRNSPVSYPFISKKTGKPMAPASTTQTSTWTCTKWERVKKKGYRR